MGFTHVFRLLSECLKLAGIDGLTACCKYLFGGLKLPDLDIKGSVFPAGGSDA